MITAYRSDLKAFVTLDDKRRVQHILHTPKYSLSEKNNARLAAADYLRRQADTFSIPSAHLKNLNQPVSFLDPHTRDIEYRYYETKKFFAASTFCYYQTIHNVPVWRTGATVTVKPNPYRIIHADNYGHRDLTMTLPPDDVIKRVRAALLDINRASQPLKLTHAVADQPLPSFVSLSSIFGTPQPARGKRATNVPDWMNRVRVKRALFYVYRYDAEQRQPKNAINFPPAPSSSAKRPGDGPEAVDIEFTLPLPPVPSTIRTGEYYLVVEVVFTLGGETKGALNWKALIEVETGAILWLRAMIAAQVMGKVFTYDPKTFTGDLGNDADSNNATLNPLRQDQELLNLDLPPGMSPQDLAGSNVIIVDDDAPAFDAPSEPGGNPFDYDARTNEFAAVNAYYHTNNFFDVVEDLGFTLTDYFDGTTFPVHVDHRASLFAVDGVEINAFCGGDGPGGTSGDGIGLVGYCLSDDTNVPADADTVNNPLGRSVDKWVHWHELGGHGILWDHVNSGFFALVGDAYFAHSAGDTLAAFQNDPESAIREDELPERFQYAPFRTWPPGSERWFNRTVAAGWGWGGSQDDGDYKTEQIIATTLFRVYQSLGGDADELNKRKHASRVATYLVLNAVGHCSPMDNPDSAEALYNKLVLADADDWTSEGYAGGAYNKVIRWSFEKQDLWNGDPPDVDLYIDDGRGGEYPYQPVFWHNQSVWNRQDDDDSEGHQNAIEDADNFAYVKVKNRGTINATGTVKLYHCKPGAGLVWPTDFEQVEPIAGISTGNVQANNGNEVTVGPFTWQPNANVYGHDCLLAIVSTAQDPSNVDNLEPGQTINEWRLVPHDNNIGQRNVSIVGGGSGEALGESLNGAVFFAGNNFNKVADMELNLEVPRVLTAKGWQIGFVGLPTQKFQLKPGEKRRIELSVTPGSAFTPDDIRNAPDRAIRVTLLGNGMILGGLTYQIDPNLMGPSGGKPKPGAECQKAADKLLDCLNISGSRKVKKICVKKVTLDVELDNDCCD